MTWARTLELAPQKFDKLTSTYGQILSYARQGPELEIFCIYVLCVEFYCDHFKHFPVFKVIYIRITLKVFTKKVQGTTILCLKYRIFV
jgi:hypothetical protein